MFVYFACAAACLSYIIHNTPIQEFFCMLKIKEADQARRHWTFLRFMISLDHVISWNCNLRAHLAYRSAVYEQQLIQILFSLWKYIYINLIRSQFDLHPTPNVGTFLAIWVFFNNLDRLRQCLYKICKFLWFTINSSILPEYGKNSNKMRKNNS